MCSAGLVDSLIVDSVGDVSVSATVSDSRSGIVAGFCLSGTWNVTATMTAMIAASSKIPVRSFFVSRDIVQEGLAQQPVDKHGSNQQRCDIANDEQNRRHDSRAHGAVVGHFVAQERFGQDMTDVDAHEYRHYGQHDV